MRSVDRLPSLKSQNKTKTDFPSVHLTSPYGWPVCLPWYNPVQAGNAYFSYTCAKNAWLKITRWLETRISRIRMQKNVRNNQKNAFFSHTCIKKIVAGKSLKSVGYSKRVFLEHVCKKLLFKIKIMHITRDRRKNEKMLQHSS